MINNKTFYPTPPELIDKMLSKIKQYPNTSNGYRLKILEPHAGKGDIIKALEKHRHTGSYDISAIEIDETLQATLRGEHIKVIGTDFLTYSGLDRFDLIIANPPFDEGDKHLLKAIDMLYSGEIIFLLNAETIKNPYTNTRKLLVKKLKKLNAEIEYIEGAFVDAERPTGVKIALIYIQIVRNIADDMFVNCDDKTDGIKAEFSEEHELSTAKNIEELVAEYNQTINCGIEIILRYYKHYRKIGEYISLNDKLSGYSFSSTKNITGVMQNQINDLLAAVRTSFWRKILDIKAVYSRLTSDKHNKFEKKLQERYSMDFTVANIQQFILNIIGGFEKTLYDTVIEIFDMFTIKYAYRGEVYDDNIHYYNGWKTNKAFKVNKKVIIPMYGLTDKYSSNNSWKLDYDSIGKLNDIDIVMRYFNGLTHSNWTIAKAIQAAFVHNQSSKIDSEYFTITCYKKGTIHLVFKDDDILRRFNVAACLGKNWLPHEYGQKKYSAMSSEEKEVIDSFEGEKSYTDNLGKPLLTKNNMLQLTV